MTWDEFKQAVDKALADVEETGEIEINYIDITPSDSKVFIYIDTGMLCVH